MRQTILHLLQKESGSNIVEVALLMPIFLLLLVGAVDFGRAYYIAIEVNSAAHAAALYGTQNFTDTVGMQTVATNNAKDVDVTSTASFGCECYDGASSSCTVTTNPCDTGNLLYFVQVNTSATYSPILPYPGVPASMVLNGQARMRAAY